MQVYKHILWDWNGTLFDDLALCVNVMNTLLSKRGLPLLDAERYRQVFTFPVRDYYRTLGFDFATDSFEALSVEFMSQYEARRAECRLAPYAYTTLTKLQAAGLPQSVLSAYPHEGLVQIVEHFGITHFFDALIGLADIYAHSKVELGQRWMRQQGYGPAEVVLIGDTTHDFEVARAMGAECILVAGGHNAEARLRQCQGRVVASLEALKAVLLPVEEGANAVELSPPRDKSRG
jgi:phosphoglycolate phosphatase